MSNQVPMRPCKKPCVIRSPNEGVKDHISELPDGVIGHILSCLPIKDAVRTSVLSQKWERKWTSMSDIEIKEVDEESEEEEENENEEKSLNKEAKLASFVNFVTRVLMRTCNSRIRTFSLSCGEHNIHNNYLETWISWVLMRNAENLSIMAHYTKRIDSRWCFSGWTLLTKLELYMSCTLTLPVDVQFPNLKWLCLVKGYFGEVLKIKSEQIPAANRIILKFPVLQSLIMRYCEWMDVNFVEIHAPELISFDASVPEELNNYEIKIFGNKLAMFHASLGSIDNFDLHAPAISCVSLFHLLGVICDPQVQKTIITRIHRILNQFPNLPCLRLSGEIVKALVSSSTGSRLAFPMFNRLKEFHLISCYIKYALNILQALPCLESLSLDLLLWSGNVERWPPEMLSNLRKVELYEFYGEDVQFDFAKYLLENVRNLNEMWVFNGIHQAMPLDEITRRLLKLVPKTSSCRLEVGTRVMRL